MRSVPEARSQKNAKRKKQEAPCLPKERIDVLAEARERKEQAKRGKAVKERECGLGSSWKERGNLVKEGEPPSRRSDDLRWGVAGIWSAALVGRWVRATSSGIVSTKRTAEFIYKPSCLFSSFS
jgi:hypothetical protein